MPQDNYYKILELDYKVTDPAQIKKAINDSRKMWSQRASIAKFTSMARKNMKLLNQALEDLNKPEIWEEHAQKARQLDEEENLLHQQRVEKDLRASIAIIAKKGWVEEAEVTSLSDIFQLGRQDVIAEIDFPIETRTVQPEKTKKEAVDLSTIKKIVTICEKLEIETAHSSNIPSLYDFLNVAPTTSTQQLDKVADDAYNIIRKEIDRDIYNDKIFLQGQSKTFFKSEADRKKYDRALSALRLKKLDTFLQIATASKTLHKPVVQKLKEKAISFGNLSNEEADAFIKEYCQNNGIDIMDGAETEAFTDITKCSACDHINDPNHDHCTNCSASLTVTCPSCQHVNQAYYQACGKCGLFLGNMMNVPYLMSEVDRAIYEQAFDKATMILQDILTWWPNHPEASSKLRMIQAKTAETKKILSTIEQLYQEEQYYRLRQLFIDHKAIVQTSTSLQSMEKESLERIHLAESYVKQAENTADDAKKADYYIKAVNIAPDCTKASKNLAKWPPAAPTQLQAFAEPKHVALQWQGSKSNGPIVYRVLRKQDQPSQHVNDGDVLDETSNTEFSDKTATGGYPYYYTVYAMRGDIVSNHAETVGPIIRTSEVDHFDITQTDDHIELSWQKPAGAMTIEVWRKENDVPTRRQDGELISDINGESMIDDQVTYGNRYGYLVIAVYEVDGIKTYSKGLSRTHTFASIPKNIQHIRSKRQSDGILLNWDPLQASADQFVIYYAYSPFTKIKKGTLALDELPTTAEKVAIDDKKNEQFLQVNMQETVYLLPVTYNEEVAVVHDMIVSKDHPEVANIRHHQVGDKIVFKWQWPAQIDEVVIACRSDRFASDPKDIEDQIITLQKANYEKDGGFSLPLEKRDYYLTVFTSYDSNGMSMHSNGTNDLYVNTAQVNITYEIKAPMFSKKMRLHLYVDEAVTLPELVLVKGNDVPRMREQGEDILTIEPQKIIDTLRVDIPTEFLQAHTFAKLFFENELDTQKFRLQARQGNDSLQLG